ncbi:hypothetical protein [Pelomonas cellulosilytica]|uniref:DUF4383 domain-containing protein n=1 Tax=Pelomonas cellulosilytica TaxID=2906762 RepID=A0ABS8Y1J6_9BURK|nr:hypothetical protein [Pelomonas sp. P8]MCE4556962.1 hypothetical protein [Pelomonas sp. P8]
MAAPAFSWARLWLGATVGATVALILSWLVAPEIASVLVLGHGYEGPGSATDSLLLADVALSFLAFVLGARLSHAIVRSKPYWACFAVGALGWAFYLFEMGGFSGLFTGEYPLWYELAPTHWGASLLAARWAARDGGRPTAD